MQEFFLGEEYVKKLQASKKGKDGDLKLPKLKLMYVTPQQEAALIRLSE